MQPILKSVMKTFIALFLYLSISLAETHTLELGDIVLRAGNNLDSLTIQKLGNVRYSHIGVITQITPEILVTHATTDDSPHFPNQVITTPYIEFISHKFAKEHLIIRPNFLSAHEKITFANDIHTKIGSPYSLKSKDQDNLYCTTLIEQPLLKLRPALTLQWHSIKFGPFNGEYLFPDTFITIDGMQIIEPRAF